MAELGDAALALHKEVGEKAKQAGIDALYATGEYSQSTVSAFGDNGFWFHDKDSLSSALNDDLKGNEIVLIKGSRSAAMEQVVDRILAHEKNHKRAN